ncbi:ABC transporter permease [Prosthecomicrobium hirschii]|uniref:ABC transporter permease n=1 Tax=Prosthecodimorpha hirschii TaxID=665126 RepID=UPI00221F12E4|nr:ABC transporter permease [Prosthecomicrobium hirschii]MCW1839804.1 ABC transporter permease [Prosthecomicrobium hirschii]
MIRLEPRGETPRLLALTAPVVAALVALALAAIPIMAAGAPLLKAYQVMFEGALGSRFALTEVVSRATPLILTGLAAAIAFRARLYNIGAEGQLYLGAVAAVAVGSGRFDGPPALMIAAVLIAGAVAGALLMLGPTLMKVKLGADEVVTTLLLNFIVILFVQIMIEGPMKDPMSLGWPQSEPIIDSAALPKLIEKTRVHAGLIVALVAALGVHVFLAHTVPGFRIRAVGANPAAARFAGMSVTGTMLLVGALSGALAGLAGVGEVAGLKGYLTNNLSPGYGYAGIVVAMLAGLSPLGVVLAAFFVAAVFVGADSMSRGINVSSYIANLIVALALISVLVSGVVTRWRIRFGRPGG